MSSPRSFPPRLFARIGPARSLSRTAAILLGVPLLSACDTKVEKTAQTEPPARDTAALKAPAFDRVKRQDFNRIAAELALPIFWSDDRGRDGAVAPDELAVLWGVRPTSRDEWIVNGQFSPAFVSTYERIAATQGGAHGPEGADERELKRRQAVLKELAQGRQTLIASSFKGASDEDRAIARNILEAAQTIEKLYGLQKGTQGLREQIPENDASSQMLFYRNQGPWCAAPLTEEDPDCSALANRPARISGLYPENIQREDKAFCEKLAGRKDAGTLLHPFHVVRADEGGKLKAVPYHEVFKSEMESVSRSLKAAGDAIISADEGPFKAYLLAAAQAFLDNNWEPADEAWSKMNAQNSKWYLRIAPDEVYFEPCSRKAGFHVSFARINQDSLAWQNKLDPVKNEMESTLAALGGKPYKARKVSFHLPDFIDIIVNAGDSRPPHGATIGQSLPNWGPVANEGRGRTVAMTNLYTDADSMSAFRGQVESLFCASAMSAFTEDQDPAVMSIVLHEAAHNLGPSHEYRVNGKTDDDTFGGPLASTLEELKAQTSALFFTDWLVEKSIIPREMANRAHLRDVAWAFGHISRGMYQDNGKPKPYSQLAAIQFGHLLKEGAMTWNADEAAANKGDKGCFALDLERFPAAVKKLTTTVVGIKARGDKKLAESLVKEFVDKEGLGKELLGVIRDRWLRSPKASFVYAIEL